MVRSSRTGSSTSGAWRATSELFAVEPSQQADGEVEDVDALLLLQRLRVVPDVEESLLQPLGGEAGLQLAVGVPRGDAALVHLIVARLRDAAGDLVVGVEPRALLGGEFHTGAEAQRLALGQQAKDFVGLLVDDLDGTVVLRPQRDVEQPVAGREVKERAAFLEQPIANGGESLSLSHGWRSSGTARTIAHDRGEATLAHRAIQRKLDGPAAEH